MENQNLSGVRRVSIYAKGQPGRGVKGDEDIHVTN